MDVEIHPNAKKHLTEKHVLSAWLAVAIGWLPDGRSVELVAVELVRGWLIIHALSPVQKKFWQEIEQARQRGR